MNNKNVVYNKVKEFVRKYPGTIAWRLKAHSRVAEKYLNDDEEVLYVFAGQKGPSSLDMIRTYVVVITNKRFILAQKRLIFGYFYHSITPDLFNDFTIKSGILWGRIIIDTVKETVVMTNLSKSSLPELETVVSKYMIQKKRSYKTSDEEDKDILSEESE